MESDPSELAQRIARLGRAELEARLRLALEREAALTGGALSPSQLDRLVAEAAVRADGALWRRALAQVASEELAIGLGEAIDAPAVLRAHELVAAPPYLAPAGGPAAAPLAPPAPAAEAVRLPAVHIGGLEALRSGERDLELRFSNAGLDVLKRSSGAPIGRLGWEEIEGVQLPRRRRGLLRGALQLHVDTGRGRASFELPGVTEAQLDEHLQPLLTRARARGSR